MCLAQKLLHPRAGQGSSEHVGHVEVARTLGADLEHAGAPIARNLEGGFPLTVHDVDGAAADRLVAAGATRAESPRAVTIASDVVVTMVPDAPDIEAVALGPDGILADARPGLIYIDMSTIDQFTTRRVGAALAARGVRTIDCRRHGVPLVTAALQFPLAHAAVASVVTGARSRVEVDANTQLVRRPIPAAFWQELKAEGLLTVAAPVP
jgi:NAD binding domain of 6-phosphogluconate dehydrogenase